MDPVTRSMDAGPFHREIAAPAAPLPPEAAIEMPEQSLREYDRARRHALRREPSANVARIALFAAALALTIFLTHQMRLVLGVGGMTGIEWAMLFLFVINISWIGLGAMSPLMGLIVRPGPGIPETPVVPKARTALLMPTYNEDPARIVGAAVAMLKAIGAKGGGEVFDLFLLSDTNRPDVWLAEQAMVDAARRDPAIGDRLHYRHRGRNLRRKAGNIADWVERWGGAYPFMLVLDADSLMEAETVIELARRMEADETLGILQTSPYLIGGETPLARVQQFASRVYGPLLVRGLRAWFGNAGNYWGHNAIIRTRAFAECGGLPELPGKPPFGGLILSHDFVEAALVRRGGYAVRMADDLPGSYEHAPPNLIELAARNRRWCQGNLQHSRLLATRGMHPLSRLHLFMGIMSYLSSPLWLLFLLSGMSLALHAYLVPPDYFTNRWSLFPDWPRIDPERAMMLFGLCMLVLFGPKIVGTIAFLFEKRAKGLRISAIFSVLVEILLSALVAPVMMLVQTSSVIQILTGRDSGWNPQARDADRVPWGLLWRFHQRHMYMGILLALAAAAISWLLLAWMSPALIGLFLAVPVSYFMASGRAGAMLRRIGLLTTPEERTPPALVHEAEAEADRLRESPPPPATATALLDDPDAFARHMAWLDAPTERPLGMQDANLASALLKLADGLGTDSLDAREAFALLASGPTLQRLADRRC